MHSKLQAVTVHLAQAPPPAEPDSKVWLDYHKQYTVLRHMEYVT